VAEAALDGLDASALVGVFGAVASPDLSRRSPSSGAEANRSLAEQHQAELVRWERVGQRGRPQGDKPELAQVPEPSRASGRPTAVRMPRAGIGPLLRSLA
jgi:hypothetical protein